MIESSQGRQPQILSLRNNSQHLPVTSPVSRYQNAAKVPVSHATTTPGLLPWEVHPRICGEPPISPSLSPAPPLLEPGGISGKSPSPPSPETHGAPALGERKSRRFLNALGLILGACVAINNLNCECGLRCPLDHHRLFSHPKAVRAGDNSEKKRLCK